MCGDSRELWRIQTPPPFEVAIEKVYQKIVPELMPIAMKRIGQTQIEGQMTCESVSEFTQGPTNTEKSGNCKIAIQSGT